MFTRCALSASTSFSSSAHIVPSIIALCNKHTQYAFKSEAEIAPTKIFISFHISQEYKNEKKKEINKEKKKIHIW